MLVADYRLARGNRRGTSTGTWHLGQHHSSFCYATVWRARTLRSNLRTTLRWCFFFSRPAVFSAYRFSSPSLLLLFLMLLSNVPPTYARRDESFKSVQPCSPFSAVTICIMTSFFRELQFHSQSQGYEKSSAGFLKFRSHRMIRWPFRS